MNIKFKKIHIHHFMSFDDSTIDLQDKGYCLVSGINKNPKDNAKSNGSGKSTIWNAICYGLVGETTNGLKSNLGNIYFNDGCYVELDFDVDNDTYKLIRSKEDKTLGTNLKVIVNGVDKSGKGIRESQAVLDELLPDLTSELIGSVIILGQGLPQKFTNNTPSGRKEVLEHLSKSDYMIQDIKNRLNERSITLGAKIRTQEDTLLKLDTKESLLSSQLESKKRELEQYSISPDFELEINTLNETILKIDNEIKVFESNQTVLAQKQKECNDAYNIKFQEKQTKWVEFNNIHNEATLQYNTRINDLNNEIRTLDAEVRRLDSITDICPTCGQKIPNVFKPDTTKQKEEIKEKKLLLENVRTEQQDDSVEFKDALTKLEDKYKAELERLKAELDNANKEINLNNVNLTQKTRDKSTLSLQLTSVKNRKENFESNKQKILESISSLEKQISDIKQNKEVANIEKTSLSEHLDVINKMVTLVKRDFRGFLLTNVITYINQKAKEYSSQIFNTDELEFKLDGNNIDIVFCGKDFDNLSGGEKQRVDLIIQFAIRDMMCNYLRFSSNILVLDEITDALDTVSCDKVLNFITNNLSVESVFIISHHSDELEIAYDSELVVEKNIYGVSNVL